MSQTEMFAEVSGGLLIPKQEFARQLQTSAPDPLRAMTHRGDPSTSRAAASEIKAHTVATDLHKQVLAAFDVKGGLTDEELESLPQFSKYGPSTIRKRRSELFQAGRLEADGERENQRGKRMTVWRIKL